MHVDGSISVSEWRDIELASAPKRTVGTLGRNVIAVIGIDLYHHWRRLANAVRDATGTVALFERLGFEQVTAPLLDDRATGKAIQSLVTDGLRTLGPDDSLVLFYAGHGGTREHRFDDRVVKTGYLIPVDASSSPGEVATWIDLKAWLSAVSLLPAKHILVVLDACHSGIALGSIIKWRDLPAPRPLGAPRPAPILFSGRQRGDAARLSAPPDQIVIFLPWRRSSIRRESSFAAGGFDAETIRRASARSASVNDFSIV
jgi:hypothetical protein